MASDETYRLVSRIALIDPGTTFHASYLRWPDKPHAQLSFGRFVAPAIAMARREGLITMERRNGANEPIWRRVGA